MTQLLWLRKSSIVTVNNNNLFDRLLYTLVLSEEMCEDEEENFANTQK